MANPPSLVGPARDRALRGELAIHDHVCGIYETRDEMDDAAGRFLKAGLARKEQCLYISERLSPAEFLRSLAAHGANFQEAVADGSLLVVSGKEMRLALGGFTAEAMMSFLAGAETKALAGGFAGFRWGAEMTWLKQDDIQPVDLFAFEAELNRFLLEHQLVGFCQYAMEDFKAELLIAAAETHPLLVYNDTVCDNFYYVPPEEYLNPRFSETKLKRILYSIITRERLMQNLLAEV